jgi:hypothetical protein
LHAEKKIKIRDICWFTVFRDLTFVYNSHIFEQKKDVHCIISVRQVFVFGHFYCRLFCKPFIGNGLANGIAVDL